MSDTPPTGKAMTASELSAIKQKFAGDILTIPETADIFRHIDAQAAEIAALKAQLAAARNDALEEAATFIEGLKLGPIWGRHAMDEFLHRAFETAAAIRALKDQTP
jgi:glutaredoxin 2